MVIIIQRASRQAFTAPPRLTIDLGIWNHATAGALIYSETHTGVQVVAGVFSLEIGAGTSGDVFDAWVFSEADRWLEVTVDGDTYSTRQKFLSVPFALQAGQISGLAGTSCPPGKAVVGFDSSGAPLCN